MGKTVRDLLEARVGAGLTPRTGVVQIFTFVTPLLKQTPGRVGFLLVNIGPQVVFIAPTVAGAPFTTNGIRIEPNGGAVSSQWDEDGEVTAWEWQGTAIGAQSSIFALETVIERPTPEAAP